MSTVKESPVKKFPGTVTIPDYLTHPQAIAYWRGVAAARALPADTSTMMDVNYALLPSIVMIVSEWHIQGLPENITPETFPATPVRACRQLVQWLHECLHELVSEVEEAPNA